MVAFFVYVIVGQQIELQKIQHEARSVQDQLNKADQLHQDLTLERQQLTTPTYVEKLAREELGLVKPGEIPYIPAGKN
jgi:cell division protein FtsL